MRLSYLTVLLATVLFAPLLHAQGVAIRGIVMEQPQGTPEEIRQRIMADPTQRPTLLPGANVILYAQADTTTPVRAVTTGPDGRFELTRVIPGSYLLKTSFVGYLTDSRRVEVGREDLNRNIIFLRVNPLKLDELTVAGLRPEVEVKGDTVVYNAEGIKVNPDATAEDLVRRLPGITVENGQVQAQGEQVRRVLVDGQEFFGDDAALTLRNLPADIVGSVEMFDQQSDQARFTGFNDGNAMRALNIRTRPGMNVGRFGRGVASGGTDGKYLGSGNANYFNGPRRVSVLGLTNNLNQQNFSSEDLSGVNQASGGGGGGGMQMIRMGGGGGGWGGRMWGGGGAGQNFMTGNQNGINTVHSFGLNYIDRLNKDKTTINASYFLNLTDNTNSQSLERRFLNELNADQVYSENTISTSDAWNHRINGRIEHTFNPVYSVIITPRLRFSGSDRSTTDATRTRLSTTDALLNRSAGFSSNDSHTYDLSNTLLLRRRFETRGRTLSLNVRTDANATRGDQYQNLDTEFFTPVPRTFLTDQNTEIRTSGSRISAELQYTEPIGERSQLQVGLEPSWNTEVSKRDAYTPDVLDPDLTNRYENLTSTYRAQAGYRFNNEKWNWNANLAYQLVKLDGKQTLPYTATTDKTYHQVLPNANVQYRIRQGVSLNGNYRVFTRNPSAGQLQDVVDNGNPLQLRGGNPDLDPQFTHNVSLRYQRADIQRATFYFGVVNVNYTTDYIGNRTFTATGDTLIRSGITMGAGSRLTTPDNLGNSWAIRSFANMTRPVTSIKSNLSLNGGLSYTMQPTLDTGVRTEAKTIGLTGGSSLNSNISPQVDFSFSYFGTYSIVDNGAAALGIDNNYYTGRAFGRVNLLPKGRYLFSSDLNVTHYAGLGDEFNQNTVYWNASAGYKFLTNNAAEVRVTVYDILGQNNSVNRQVNDGYIEDVRSQVLSRFAMVSFSYNFRNFNRNATATPR
jgi:hypothetical protein